MASVQTQIIAAPGGRPLPMADRFRRASATTPGRLRLLSLLIVIVVALSAAAAIGTIGHRQGGVRTVSTDSEPLIVDAQALDTLLSQANAAATNAFLGGGIESAAQRGLYLDSLRSASQIVADAAGRSGSDAAARADLRTLAEQIPVYAGLVETARSNNRQLFPIGAAYLRQASRLLAETILPAAQKLYTLNAARLSSGEHQARSPADIALLALAVLVVVATLVGVQIWLRRRTNRLFNPALVAATVLAGMALLFSLVSLRSEAAEIGRAGDRGYASINALAQARIVAFRAKADESLTLIGRGNGGDFDTDFNAQAAKATSYLDVASTTAVSGNEQTTVNQASSALRAYLAVHQRIRKADDQGHFGAAVTMAVDTSGKTETANGAFAAVDTQLSSALDASQTAFNRRTHSASNTLSGLIAIDVLALLGAVLLALLGVQQRINEYR